MNRKDIITIVLILLFSAALRAALIPSQLPFHYQSDEFQIIERALRMGTGELNPGLFTWPGSLTIYLNFALYGIYFLISLLVGGISSASEFARAYWTDPTPFYVVGRAISTAFGLLAVFSVYVTARNLTESGKLGDKYISGLFAGIAAVLVPEMVIDSAFALPDMAATGLAAFSFSLAVSYFAKPRRATAIAVGVAMGTAIACKYNAVFLVPALIATVLFCGNRPVKGRVTDSAIVLALIPVSFILFCPFAILDFGTFSGDIAGLMQRQGMMKWAPDIRFLCTETLSPGLTHRFMLLIIISAGAVAFTRNANMIANLALA
ncbi:MAG: glycosyltransferase family 39 protein, partial [bacterium]|nr:glycosyltransferase family 39 protein [bacterium]